MVKFVVQAPFTFGDTFKFRGLHYLPQITNEFNFEYNLLLLLLITEVKSNLCRLNSPAFLSIQHSLPFNSTRLAVTLYNFLSPHHFEPSSMSLLVKLI
jgi:hypothetical protein